MTSDPLARRRAAPATELAEAVQAQIHEAREVLRADAQPVSLIDGAPGFAPGETGRLVIQFRPEVANLTKSHSGLAAVPI